MRHVLADCHVLKRKQSTRPVTFVKGTSTAGTEHCMLKGFVLLSGMPEDQVPVQVLCDTGATQSCICRDVLLLSEQLYPGSSVLVQGIGMETLQVPLHRVHFQTNLS